MEHALRVAVSEADSGQRAQARRTRQDAPALCTVTACGWGAEGSHSAEADTALDWMKAPAHLAHEVAAAHEAWRALDQVRFGLPFGRNITTGQLPLFATLRRTRRRTSLITHTSGSCCTTSPSQLPSSAALGTGRQLSTIWAGLAFRPPWMI